MLTRAAGTFMSRLHDREPVSIPAKNYAAWLDQGNANGRPVLRGFDEPPLLEYPVARYVNGCGAEGPECVIPLHREHLGPIGATE